MESETDIRRYYTRSFPGHVVWRLFAREWQHNIPPERREYGTETHPGGRFIRWKSCATPAALHAFVSDPEFGKLNVGAMFDKNPLERWRCLSGKEPRPIMREFVVDIDADDSPIAGDINSVSSMSVFWPVIATGLTVADAVLRETFGFENILLVHSGRRGGHLWVCDKRACFLEDGARQAIVSWMQSNPKESKTGRRQFQWILQHPSFGKYDNPMAPTSIFTRFVIPFFRGYCMRSKAEGGLGLLDTGFEREQFVDMVDDGKGVFAPVRSNLRSAPNGLLALQVIERHLKDMEPAIKKPMIMLYCESVCTLIWPRLDANVSAHMNHTLKSPFSVHPKSGMVSMPIFGSPLDFRPETDLLRAEHPMPEAFHACVRMTNIFIDKLATSATERWEKRDLGTLDVPPKRLKIEGSHDEPSVVEDHDRLCWVCTRSLSVRVEKDMVCIEMATRCYSSPPTQVIKAHTFPPFPNRKTTGNAKLVSAIDDVVQAISHAKERRGVALSATSWTTIFICKPRNSSGGCAVDDANKRFERMRDRLSEPWAVTAIPIAMGMDAVEAHLRKAVLPLVEVELRFV